MNEELNAILQKQIIGKDDPRFEFFSDDFYGDFYDFPWEVFYYSVLFLDRD